MKNRTAVVFTLLLAFQSVAEAELIRNGGFEQVPGTGVGFQGQGLMPSDWVSVAFSPDTYSNDGSYGLAANFANWPPGTLAFEGLRWVAGANAPFGTESFGQSLGSTLTPGLQYSLSGHLHQDRNRGTGGFEIFLADDDSGSNAVSLGILGNTNDPADGWVARSLAFTAPATAHAKPFLLFAPRTSSTTLSSSYPGLDAVSLSAASVPEPSAFVLLALGTGLLAFSRRRRHSIVNVNERNG